MVSTPRRASLLLALVIGVFGWFGAIGGMSASINSDRAAIAACTTDISTAQATIAHASQVDRLSDELLAAIDGEARPKNETEFVQDVWTEIQRTAAVHHVVITDIHHDKLQVVILATPAPAITTIDATPTPDVCLGEATATPSPAAQRTPEGRSGVTGAQGAFIAQGTSPEQSSSVDDSDSNKASEAGIRLQVLPTIVALRGSYPDIIDVISSLSPQAKDSRDAPVLLRYESSTWGTASDVSGATSATLTLLAYPPIEIDSLGHPVGELDSLNPDAVPATPSPSPSPASSSPGGTST